MHIHKLILTSLFALLLSGCLYANITTPLDVNLDKTKLGSKIGKATSHGAAWSVLWGDSSTRAAAENGEIETINHADQQVMIVLFGAYSRRTTIVYGD